MTEHKEQGPRPEDGPMSVAEDTPTRDVLHHDAITTDPAEVVQLGPNENPPGVTDADDTTTGYPGPVPPNANDGDRPVPPPEDDEVDEDEADDTPTPTPTPTTPDEADDEADEEKDEDDEEKR